MLATYADKRIDLSLWVFLGLAFGLSWSGWVTLQVLLATDPESPFVTPLFFSGVAVSLAAFAGAAVLGRGQVLRLLRESLRVNAGLTGWAIVFGVPTFWIVASALTYAATHEGLGAVDLAGYWAVMSRPDGLINLSYPVNEEIAWRGLLLPLLMTRFRALPAALIVGAIWAVWHAPFYWMRILENPLWFATFSLGVVCLSVIFAGLYLMTRSILAAMAIHWHINAVQDAAGPLFPDLPELGGGHDPYALILIGVMIAVAIPFAVMLAGRGPEQLT
jgi:membrane protease YdiL (CAAX protease family)